MDAVKYRADNLVREEALSHLQNLEILLNHIYRNDPIWRGITNYNAQVIKDFLLNANSGE